jgi:hypothetical protein
MDKNIFSVSVWADIMEHNMIILPGKTLLQRND